MWFPRILDTEPVTPWAPHCGVLNSWSSLSPHTFQTPWCLHSMHAYLNNACIWCIPECSVLLQCETVCVRNVRLCVWQQFLVSFTVDAVVSGLYVQYATVLLLDCMCEKCQTWWRFLLSFIVDAVQLSMACVCRSCWKWCTQSPPTPSSVMSTTTLVSAHHLYCLCLCLCVFHTYTHMFTCTCQEEVVGLCVQGTWLEIKRLLV